MLRVGDLVAGDPDVVGSQLRLGETSYRVVGVAPSDFDFPAAHNLGFTFIIMRGPLLGVAGRYARRAERSIDRAEPFARDTLPVSAWLVEAIGTEGSATSRKKRARSRSRDSA